MRTNPDLLWQCPEALESWLVGCSDLIVSDERAQWIMKRYPETDMGRPGIIGASRGGVRNTDVRVEREEVEEFELVAAE